MTNLSVLIQDAVAREVYSQLSESAIGDAVDLNATLQSLEGFVGTLPVEQRRVLRLIVGQALHHVSAVRQMEAHPAIVPQGQVRGDELVIVND